MQIKQPAEGKREFRIIILNTREGWKEDTHSEYLKPKRDVSLK